MCPLLLDIYIKFTIVPLTITSSFISVSNFFTDFYFVFERFEVKKISDYDFAVSPFICLYVLFICLCQCFIILKTTDKFKNLNL